MVSFEKPMYEQDKSGRSRWNFESFRDKPNVEKWFFDRMINKDSIGQTISILIMYFSHFHRYLCHDRYINWNEIWEVSPHSQHS